MYSRGWVFVRQKRRDRVGKLRSRINDVCAQSLLFLCNSNYFSPFSRQNSIYSFLQSFKKISPKTALSFLSKIWLRERGSLVFPDVVSTPVLFCLVMVMREATISSRCLVTAYPLGFPARRRSRPTVVVGDL